MLKLSKGQLETAAAHVATAVEPDTWLRVFLAPSGTGLLYTSEQGGCTLAEPAGVWGTGRPGRRCLLCFMPHVGCVEAYERHSGMSIHSPPSLRGGAPS